MWFCRLQLIRGLRNRGKRKYSRGPSFCRLTSGFCTVNKADKQPKVRNHGHGVIISLINSSYKSTTYSPGLARRVRFMWPAP